MAAKFVCIDHDSPLLLPPDLRDWLPPEHMVHFIMDAVDALDLSQARVNERGTGSAQYPPSMMLGLLIYCYATDTFSSRRIETLTYENVAVRYLTADTHPDHDSICKFRRENKELLSSCFHQVLELAAGAEVLKVGDLTVEIHDDPMWRPQHEQAESCPDQPGALGDADAEKRNQHGSQGSKPSEVRDHLSQYPV